MRQELLKPLKRNGELDRRTLRWETTPSFAKLSRLGQMGGDIRYRKSRRPFDSKQALHVVLKSDQCRPDWNFTHPLARLKIIEMARALAKKSGLKLYKIAVVHNHIHLLMHAKRRHAVSDFLRSFAGVLAKRMRKWAQAKRIGIQGQVTFWSARPYTRLVKFGRQWRNVLKYLEKNRQEAIGFVAYSERNHALPKLIQKIRRRLKALGDSFDLTSSA